MKQGLFVVFEGIDGSGTTTQSGRLVDALRERGCDVLQTREPGGTLLGEKIRDLVLNPDYGSVDPVAELLLYGASRRQHVQALIEPALSAGKHVICDRYAASTVAYQGAGRGLDSTAINAVNELAMGGRDADVTIVLDLSVDEALRRRRNRGESEDRLEMSGQRLQGLAREAYRQFAATEPERRVVIDATGGEDTVFEAVKQTLIDRWPSLQLQLDDAAGRE